MSAIGLLLGLLVLSYVGSILVGGRTIRGFGLPSGAEYLVFGFVLGPHALGVVTSSLVEAFAPILLVGSAWVAFVAGIGYGQVGSRSIDFGRAAVGVLLAGLVGAGVAFATWVALGVFATQPLAASERWLLAASAGTVCSATTRHAVRWVVERHGAKGLLSDTLADYARASVLVPAVALAFIFAAAPNPGLSLFGFWGRVVVTFAVGILLGLVATLLLGREFRRDESWGILLGTSLLGIGIATRLGLSAISTLFFLGLTVAVVSPHRRDLKMMATPSEKPVLLPVTVLAGASVEPAAAPFALGLLLAGIAGRILMELLRGSLLSMTERGRAAGPLLGLALVSTGSFSIASAIALKQRLPPELGASVLLFAALSLLLGELLGPLMLRRALTRAGEIVPGETHAPPPPSVDPSRTELPGSS